MRSMLTLSNPAARASPTTSHGTLGRVHPPETFQFVIPKRLDPEAQTIDTGCAKLFQGFGGHTFGIRLERDLRAADQPEHVARLVDDRRDFRRRQE